MRSCPLPLALPNLLISHIIFLLTALATPTHQVDITITQSVQLRGWDMTATCPNVLPGQCCRSPTDFAEGDGTVAFIDLTASDIAVIWRERYGVNEASGEAYSIRGCSGSVM
ncbi:MAG: hypothetical protein Q9213_006230, partial [Squamulea squamosa]